MKKFEWLDIQLQLKIKMLLGTVLLMSQYQKERRFIRTGQRRRCQLHMANCYAETEKDNTPKSTELCQSCGVSICRKHSTRVCHGWLQSDFILFFIFIALNWAYLFVYALVGLYFIPA